MCNNWFRPHYATAHVNNWTVELEIALGWLVVQMYSYRSYVFSISAKQQTPKTKNTMR